MVSPRMSVHLHSWFCDEPPYFHPVIQCSHHDKLDGIGTDFYLAKKSYCPQNYVLTILTLWFWRFGYCFLLDCAHKHTHTLFDETNLTHNLMYNSIFACENCIVWMESENFLCVSNCTNVCDDATSSQAKAQKLTQTYTFLLIIFRHFIWFIKKTMCE